jgi:hypothetical protein
MRGRGRSVVRSYEVGIRDGNWLTQDLKVIKRCVDMDICIVNRS